uniref:peptide chain release factor N(5)-glutamine methyltransferase n=1 Tax=uncultured Draconibacterium sp. TaxID=1573823 RepID=UPI003216BBE2
MQRTIQYIKTELTPCYPETEIEGFIRIIFESVLSMSYTQLILEKDKVLTETDFNTIEKIVSALKTHQPIQYILGETEFYDLTLKVNPAVLIPRPETEELVQWICKSNLKPGARILDIGTGSGCIALALKNELKQVEVNGVDISVKALETAKDNAKRNGLNVEFAEVDILNWKQFEWQQYDLIVSNPPYVRECEKAQMDANVLDYEPEGALFVEDENPLIFYRTIAEFALDKLNSGGWLFFEINEFLGSEMVGLLKELGYNAIELRPDINGKDRMLACRKM